MDKRRSLRNASDNLLDIHRGGQATPIVYEQDGKEYLAIMAGGHHFMMTPPGDALIAYALPDTK
jgi:glucose dehydrogenase